MSKCNAVLNAERVESLEMESKSDDDKSKDKK